MIRRFFVRPLALRVLSFRLLTYRDKNEIPERVLPYLWTFRYAALISPWNNKNLPRPKTPAWQLFINNWTAISKLHCSIADFLPWPSALYLYLWTRISQDTRTLSSYLYLTWFQRRFVGLDSETEEVGMSRFLNHNHESRSTSVKDFLWGNPFAKSGLQTLRWGKFLHIQGV